MPSTAFQPLRDLWFRPRAAIDAALARPCCALALLIALATISLAISVAFPDALATTFQISPSLGAAAAVAVLAFAAGYFYFTGWWENAIARALGGHGSAAATRAAIAWSSVPLLVGSLAALALKPESALAAGVVEWAFVVWSYVLFVAMLAHVQAFGVVRALVCLFVAFLAFPLILVLALLARGLLVEPFDIPSTAMEPTLLPGDHFLVAKSPYGYSRFSFPPGLFHFQGRIFAGEPKRGDVVVFRHEDSAWVKRVVGMPGEEIRLTAGRLYIDGKMVERRAEEPRFYVRDLNDQLVAAPTYREFLPDGISYRIIQIEGDGGPYSNTNTFKVPEGHYFVLGDNRDNSADSRMSAVGFLSLDDLIGRAEVIYYSHAPDENQGNANRAGVWLR